MYSDELVVHRNEIVNNRGVSAYGIALKDADHVTVTENLIIGNRVGIYIDNSPTRRDHTNRFTNNFIAYNDIGITAQPSVTHNVFQMNAFLENVEQAAVNGRGTLQGIIWVENGSGNYWSNYVGYDADGDGIGDMPYRAEKLFESLQDTYPTLRLFVYSPASQALDFAAAAFPSLRPEPKVIDTAPIMQYVVPTGATTPQGVSMPFLAVSLALLALGGGVCIFALCSGRIRMLRAKLIRVGV
jgi:nitrous oxidase accessory protein